MRNYSVSEYSAETVTFAYSVRLLPWDYFTLLMERKPVIFVTNDDGILAPGLRKLISVMRTLGTVIVVAPDKPQSGTAHGITIHVPLRLKTIVKEPDYEEYSCNGTPVDCVKLAFRVVMRGHPDLLVSGINHGSNASINIIYSGTMAAVFEGAMAGVPSIGFSLLNYSHDANLEPYGKYISRIAENVLERGLPAGVCLNVNIPYVSESAIRGIRICKQADGSWNEDFDERVDPGGRNYYWLKGMFVKIDDAEDTDEYALEHDYIAVVPVQFDFTAQQAIPLLNKWPLNG
jgi:5'-nucleotidase